MKETLLQKTVIDLDFGVIVFFHYSFRMIWYYVLKTGAVNLMREELLLNWNVDNSSLEAVIFVTILRNMVSESI